jgi:16S rRNA (cytidine1402-2'-O)-methyltransferase
MGKLYIVATPIGNLSDMTYRAVDVLKTVNFIAAEDTRHSQRLMQHYGITTPLKSLHSHNEKEKTAWLISRLQTGDDIALISDAGTPIISDPGESLVKQVKQVGVEVVPVPGACAFVAALSASGLPAHQFSFYGFLSSKKTQREKELSALKENTQTLIFYEAPHRIFSCLESIGEIFEEDRQVCLAKELTKAFETIIKAPASELLVWLQEDERRQKGEFVILIDGADKKDHELSEQNLLLLKCLMKEMPLKQAAQITAQVTGLKKNFLYQVGLGLS